MANVFTLMQHASIRRVFLFIILFGLLINFDYPDNWDISGPVVAAIIAGLIMLNMHLVLYLPFRAQVVVFWFELLTLFMVFFYSFDLSYTFIIERLPLLIFTGIGYTLLVSALSIMIASGIALVGALMRLSNNGAAFAISTFYVSFFRGTPLLLQVYLIYLGLPQLGIILDAIPSGVIALSLCYGAYMTEIFRSGIQAVPKAQTEAALALGLKSWQIMLKVVLPQAIRIIIPPTGNNFIAMLKDSSLVSAMGVMELMYLARTLGRSEFKHFEMLITAALIYWFISFLFELLQGRLEKHFGKSMKR
ncbi:amino acid ABC transporter permease [Cohaesibacter gelatinilyticus]|uniref:Amino acid ABC transporter membrane protein, PAAT family n=1 Tax=Cohaesibacter gelatinilyticus TaxID=372072 RepID=A0A285N9S1_9HYPH|nr:amino acid ABC transporter permease [Cohaesibacter gelatinilyticus]SNZ06189.1 amino acid ABC transporter membrane protein, PAAT family [Cohaesibacter gelatinilyticus]HAT86461.1 amino acid ABC transporter permease [Hyphomicrobiales bacterium]